MKKDLSVSNIGCKSVMRAGPSWIGETGKLPVDWKVANVCPIFKKGTRNDAGNDRPVSLTSVLSKTMDAIVKDRLISNLWRKMKLLAMPSMDLERENLASQIYWNPVRDGWRHWTMAIDVIYLDCRKAFDTVLHQWLLLKLCCFGISDKYVNWIANFLQAEGWELGFVDGILNGKMSSVECHRVSSRADSFYCTWMIFQIG